MNQITALMGDLVYKSYAFNRDQAPDITPESWKKIFGEEVDEFEAKYQAEKAIKKAAA